MSVDELLQQKRIYRQDSTPADVRATLERAAKDLASAEHMLSVDHGWAFPSPTTRSCTRHGR